MKTIPLLNVIRFRTDFVRNYVLQKYCRDFEHAGNEFLERLDPRELEDIQQNIVYSMIRRKTFDNAKMLKKWQVIVDATELDEGY